ncbi:MAG: branched-chain amino acid ABC transporter permease [Rhizobiaceae bacterium]|nr:branched-chain amino acid ABC transporter permease [Rhizobiaceae bacterium]
MLYFTQQILLGIHVGAIYALLAFGYVVLNALLRRTNLTHGALFAFCGHTMILAALFGWNVLWLTWPAATAFGTAIALAYALLLGHFLSRHVFEPLRTAAPNTIVAATLGVALALMELSRIAANTRDYWLPPMLSQPIVFAASDAFAVTLTINQLVGIAVSVVLIGGGWVLLFRTAFGRNWQAVANEPLAASLCGVNPARIYAAASVLAAIYAASAGVLAATYYGNISFGTGLAYGLKILFVTAAGSYVSPLAAALGAMAYGLGETVWTGYFPAEWRDAWMLAFLTTFLVLRHSGNEEQA